MQKLSVRLRVTLQNVEDRHATDKEEEETWRRDGKTTRLSDI